MAILLAILSILPMICCSTQPKRHKTIFFVSIPFIGHLNPLLRQATELYRRQDSDYDIYIISCSNAKNFVEQNCSNTTIRFIDVGECYNATTFNYFLQKAASDSNIFSSSLSIFQVVMKEIYPLMYQQMLNTVHLDISNESISKVIVTDMLTYAGARFADEFKIPLIINNADLLPSLGWFDIVPADYNPTMHLSPPQSIHTMGTNVWQRTIFPVIRMLLHIYAYFWSLEMWNTMPTTNSLSSIPMHAFMKYKSHVILVNSAWGLEYSHSLPPSIQMTGPMLSAKTSLHDYIARLSDTDRVWIESDSRPIIYVNFGTCVPVSKEQVQKISVSSINQYRILWKLNEQHFKTLESSSNIRFVRWISSTLGVLAHPKTVLFLSHCGINSAHESIWMGTPILCIPILGDQHDMAQRLADAGVGKWVDKLSFTSEILKKTIEIMLNEKERAQRELNLRRLQQIMRWHGGVERAVDLIELVSEHDAMSFMPRTNLFPWYSYYNCDVYAIWMMLFIGFKWLLVRLNRCCHPKSLQQVNKQKTS